VALKGSAADTGACGILSHLITYDINVYLGFCSRDTTSDHTVRTYFEEVGFFPEVMFEVGEKFVLLLVRHSFREFRYKIKHYKMEMVNGKLNLSREYLLNAKNYRRKSWKEALKESKWSDKLLSFACEFFAVDWPDRGESASSSNKKRVRSPYPKVQLLNVYLSGLEVLLPIEFMDITDMEHLKEMIQTYFRVAAGSYTLRYKQSQMDVDWSPLANDDNLQLIEKRIKGVWYVEVVMNNP
nr:hypothetical protein [Tanacetum cinerariifolium]